ncbi:MAG TPA: serine/threonine-protein kinase [Polyangia bacterium]|nr:serine/threonine-protein kinase [Polyangia bacterium]
MKFGQYELRELIAVGGMAEVYKGRVVGAEGFEKLVAIKRILPDLAEDERFVKMLLTEARIHAGLSHRNIVQIHDLGISEDGEYSIVLEYVEGYDLRMILDQLHEANEIVPEALSLHIAYELAQGLHFAHELRGADGQPLGLVHRDVSPSNVLISLSGEIKLSDFGLAKRRHDRSVVGSLKGNLAYMSPEQARQSELDRRTDVFSLGAVLFEMLTGQRLREIKDEVAAWNQVASGQMASLRAVRPDLPDSFERLLARALAPEPEGRIADAAMFGTAIRAVLAQMNTPVGATDLQQLLSTLHPARRPRALVPERSKVIRLGPEAQALGEAIAAPNTPPPVVSPGMTPPAPRASGGITNLEILGARRFDAPEPPPPEPPRRPSVRGLPSVTRVDRPTRPAATTDLPPARLHSAASAAVVTSSWGGGAAAAAVAVEGRPVTAERLPTIAAPTALPRVRRETARVVVREGGAWRAVVVAIAAALLLVAGGVHFFVVPLDVLVVWRRPATLAIASEPAGAVAKLDGVTVGVTPALASVRRDRADHVLQLSAPGYREARLTVRFDASVTLSARARLDKESTPTFEEMPRADAAPPARTEEPATAAAPRAKVAAKRAKAGAHGKNAARAHAATKRR